MSDERNKRRDTKNVGSYILGVTLGEGAFGKVKVATHIHTGEKVAIKILDKNKMEEDLEDIERVQTEITILKKMRHKNIIQLYEIMESTKNIYLVTEYCEAKELFDYIVMKKKLCEQEALKFFQEIIDAIDYLHSQNIVHRDLKPENLLLDYKFSIKVSDFGLSRTYTNDSLLSTACGTPSYAPPEMLKGEEYHGLLSDVWSAGVILYAMFCGYLPFSESNEEINCQKIIQGDFEMPDFLSELATDLLRNILQIDPLDRYDIEQIKQHPWFTSNAPSLRPGIIIGHHKIPIDEQILMMIEDYGYNKEKVRSNLNNNKFDITTSIYYLSLKKFIKEGGTSISDLSSDEFINFIENHDNVINNPSNKKKEEENNDKVIQNKSMVYGINTVQALPANGDNEATDFQDDTNTSKHNLKTNESLSNTQYKNSDLSKSSLPMPAGNIYNSISIIDNYVVQNIDNIKNIEMNCSPNNENYFDNNSACMITDKNKEKEKISNENEDKKSVSSLTDDNEGGDEIEMEINHRASIKYKQARLSLRMADKTSIFLHSTIPIAQKYEFVNTTESNLKSEYVNTQGNEFNPNILSNFKRKSVLVTDEKLEREKELILKSNNNPRKSINMPMGNFRQNLMEYLDHKQIHPSKSDSSDSESVDTVYSSYILPINLDKKINKVEIETNKQSNCVIKNSGNKNKSNNVKPPNNTLKNKTRNQRNISLDSSNKYLHTATITTVRNDKTIKEIIKPKHQRNISTHTNTSVASQNKIQEKIKVNAKSLKKKINVKKTASVPKENKEIEVKKNTNKNETRPQRKNKFNFNATKIKLDTSVERSLSRNPDRNLSYSPENAMRTQVKRIDVIPWNLKKKFLQTTEENEKKKIEKEYDEFKKNKNDKILNKKIFVNRIKKENKEIKADRVETTMSLDENTPVKKKSLNIKMTNCKYQYCNTEGNSPKRNEFNTITNTSTYISNQVNLTETHIVPNYIVKEFNTNPIVTTKFNYNNCNSHRNHFPKTGKFFFFNVEDIYLTQLKTYNGPLDFATISFKSISIIIEKINNYLNEKKIKYVRTNPYKFRCSKEGTSYDIEIFRLEHLDEAFFLKFRMFQGYLNNFRKLTASIIGYINSE